MTCEHVRIGDYYAIVCGRDRVRRCACGRRATLLCDAPKGKGTYDKPLCQHCAVSGGPDRDFCPAHADQARQERLEL